MRKNFVVYKSSAGSGKTTTLVKEYLKLSLTNPDNFRHILAITFTNKAANEMKSRILESLQEIISGNMTSGKLEDIIRGTGLSAEDAGMRAQQLLYKIIHAYDEFPVSTIDAFVHQIVRTFSIDLKLPQGFEVLVDEDDIVPFIVEDIYDKLGHDKDFTEILLQFVLSRVEDEKSYDLNRLLSEFVSKQLSETGREEVISSQRNIPGFFIDKIRKFRQSLQQHKTNIQELVTESLHLVEAAGVSPFDFKGGKRSSVGSYLLKLKSWPAKPSELSPKSAVLKAIEDDEWYALNLPPEKKTAIDNLAPDLKNKLIQLTEHIRYYILLRLIYNNLYQVALGSVIQELFKDFILRTRKVHISEFNKRIHREITSQPVPYIYERLGRRYHHFLIDEFQDTSVLQWENLLPLIEESLANGYFNMLVGDAKQAIYRFRHGEVELFTHLPGLYGVAETPENKQREKTLRENYREEHLAINYRSRKEIVRFNNTFFRFAGENLNNEFREIYHDVEQQLPAPPKNGGYVSVDFIPAENTEDFRHRRLDKILEIIRQLIRRNYPLKDICILTLRNASAAETAAHLLQHEIPVITSESLLLTASPAVRLTVAVMKLLTDGENKLWLAEFLMNLLQLLQKETLFHSLYAEAAGRKDAVAFILEKFQLALPEPEILTTRSVYEIATEIIRHLVKNEKPDPFLLFFLDFVFEKESLYFGSLPAFLQLWEEKKNKQNIVFPYGMDAVQIMTAHKAKGLKFGVVIADLFEMSNKLTQRQYWEHIDIPETEGLPEVLLNISKEELSSVRLGHVYDYERAKTDLDFLNKVYVAFTRPVDGLFIIGSLIGKKSKDVFSKKLIDFLDDQALWTEEKMHYAWGDFPDVPAGSGEQEPIVSLSANFSEPWYAFLEIAPVEEAFWASAGTINPRVYGKILHAILSKITYAEEAEQQVEAWYFSGWLDEKETSKIKTLVHNTVTHTQLSAYFSHEAVIKTETELYDQRSGTFKRPDRVVFRDHVLTILDYKTGTRDIHSENKYRKQITEYGDLFQKLGFAQIEKKLVYINDAGIEVVEV